MFKRIFAAFSGWLKQEPKTETQTEQLAPPQFKSDFHNTPFPGNVLLRPNDFSDMDEATAAYLTDTMRALRQQYPWILTITVSPMTNGILILVSYHNVVNRELTNVWLQHNGAIELLYYAISSFLAKEASKYQSRPQYFAPFNDANTPERGFIDPHSVFNPNMRKQSPTVRYGDAEVKPVQPDALRELMELREKVRRDTEMLERANNTMKGYADREQYYITRHASTDKERCYHMYYGQKLKALVRGELVKIDQTAAIFERMHLDVQAGKYVIADPIKKDFALIYDTLGTVSERLHRINPSDLLTREYIQERMGSQDVDKD